MPHPTSSQKSVLVTELQNKLDSFEGEIKLKQRAEKKVESFRKTNHLVVIVITLDVKNELYSPPNQARVSPLKFKHVPC